MPPLSGYATRLSDATVKSGRNAHSFVTRDEGEELSSDLIREADDLAWRRWPSERHWTYVNRKGVPGRRLDGRCFIHAGWRKCGKSAEGLLILERVPDPPPLRDVRGSQADATASKEVE